MGGGCNDGQPGKAPLSAAEVGGSFVLQYYRTLTTDRGNLHKYYKDESICSRGMEGASPDQITYTAGVDEIREELSSSSLLGAARTEINCIQSQESKQGGILVNVLGYFAYGGSLEKVHFTQVFFLDKQSDPYPGYFVLNDILRYVSGKAEHVELKAQPQEMPPPRLPPPQPPTMPAPAEVVEPVAPVEEPVEEEEEAPEEEAVEEAAEEEYQDEVAVDAAAAEAAAEVQAAAVAADQAAAEAVQEKPSPPSWASMAGKLKEGGGQLGNSKLQGFALPAPAKAKPPMPAAKSSAAPVLPPPTAAAKAKAKAAVEAAEAGEVRLWLSRIPTDMTVENQEILDSLNALIQEAGLAGQAGIDRKDLTKEWAYVTVPSQDVADSLVQNSKDRKIAVRGKSMKLVTEQKQGVSNRRDNNRGKGEDGGDKAADGNRGPRRGKGAKGGADAGGKGGKGAADAAKSDDARKGARRGGEKGGASEKGTWRAAQA